MPGDPRNGECRCGRGPPHTHADARCGGAAAAQADTTSTGSECSSSGGTTPRPGQSESSDEPVRGRGAATTFEYNINTSDGSDVGEPGADA